MERPVNVSPQTPGRTGSSKSATRTRRQSCAAPIPAPGFALVFHTSTARSPVSPASTVTYPTNFQSTSVDGGAIQNSWSGLLRARLPHQRHAKPRLACLDRHVPDDGTNPDGLEERTQTKTTNLEGLSMLVWGVEVGDGLDALGGGTRRTKDTIALHDLVHDKDGQGASAEHSEQFEGDNGWCRIKLGIHRWLRDLGPESRARPRQLTSRQPMSHVMRGSGMGTVNGRSGGKSPRSVVLALQGRASKTSRMRLMTSQSMPGVVGDTDGVDTDGVRITRWVMSLDVRERYSPDEGDDGELDGDEGTDDDGGEYDIGDDEIDEDDSLGTSGSVSNNSISNGSDSNGSDPNKLESSEWCDDRDDILELKELGERGYGVVLKEPVDIIHDNDTRTLGRWPFRLCPFGRSLFSGCQKDGSVETSSKMGSSKKVRLSKVSDPKEMEDAVETEDGVLVNATWDRCGVSMGVGTVVEYGARREGEGTVGDSVTWMVLPMQRLSDGGDSAEAETDIDTVGVREGEDVTTGLVPEKRMQKPKCPDLNQMRSNDANDSCELDVLSKMVLKGEEREWSEERSGGRWRDRYRCCNNAVPRNADTDIDTICVRRFCPREKRERIVDERPSRERERLTLPLPVGHLCPPIVSNIIHRFAVSIGVVGVVEIGHIQ
ncbi:hypothetical protein EDB92DRAFT_1822377 [Lactarius akahatsu]|uniref:Uncharacterized protein n=1 Tax=Lactarius akahatsu TaxID=416441 RepID=A0AAD4Q257_9AGAM|nr:hypothetical protein EDB92DRAFT_1822377 [Lactarius akahatsu]